MKETKGPKGQKRLKGSCSARASRLLLLSLAALFVALPAAAAPAAPQEVSTWADLETALQTDGNYILTADVAPDNPFWADALVVPSGVTATLDLNGHIVDRGYAESGWDGSVIKISGGTLTLTDSAPTADHGGAVAYTDPVTGRSVAVGGGILTGGYPDQYGGGVYLNGGTFNLEGGSIACNGVGKNGFGAEEAIGGGVYVQSGAFNMSGGAIVGNRAVNTSFGTAQGRGGGVYVAGGTFTLSGGTIRGNAAVRQGGGIYVGMSGTFAMTGGMIVGNAPVGGSVHNNSGTAPNLASIILNANYGDDGGVAEQAVLQNAVSPLATGVFVRDGYVLKGWTMAADGSGSFYADGAGIDMSGMTNVTLFAQWEIIAAYPLWVGGVQVTDANKDAITAAITAAGGAASGSAAYDPDENVLRLTDFQYTGAGKEDVTYSALYYEGTEDLVIELSGANRLEQTGVADNSFSSGTCFFAPTDAFTVTIRSADGGTLSALGGAAPGGNSYGIYSEHAHVVVSGADVTAAGGTANHYSCGGAFSWGNLTVASGSLTATGGEGEQDSIGIYGQGSAGTTISVTGGGLVAEGKTVGIDNATLSADGMKVRAGESAASAAAVAGDGWQGKKYVAVVPTYAVTVEGGSTTNSPAEAGATVTITADEPAPGYAFVQWAHNDDVDFARMDAATTTFAMPSNAVTVRAVFAKILLKDLDDQLYTGDPIEPRFGLFGVRLEGVDGILVQGNHYEVSYSNNVNAGTATATVTFLPNRTGSQSTTFRILPASISTATVTAPDQFWNGSGLKPSPTVVWRGMTLVEGEDYEVAHYVDNVDVGNATVTVKGKGNFMETSEASGTFRIVEPPVISNVTARQRWPWNALVDIDYEISGCTTGLTVEISATDVDGGRTWAATNFLAGAEPSAAPGWHRATWDMAADVAADVVASNVVATVSLVWPSVASADSAEFRMDTRTGVRESTGDEELTWSSLWETGGDATVTIAQNDVALKTGLFGEGDYGWSVQMNDTYTLTHTIFTNGAAAAVETAAFKVTGKSDPCVPFAADDIVPTDYEGIYDGAGHGIGVATNAIAGLELRYGVEDVAAASQRWSDTLPLFTNVCEAVVWVEASAPGYFTQTNSATVKIGKRAVTLTSASATKVYDGTALTTNEVVVSGAGFAAGEGATYDVTGSQTHAGGSGNAFTYSLNDGTDAGNYEITASNGTLTVTKAGNSWSTEPSMAGWTFGEDAGEPDLGKAGFGTATVTYSAMPGDAGEYTATFIVPGTDDYEGLTNTVTFTIARAIIAASATSYDGVYDGKGHGIKVTVTKPVTGATVKYAGTDAGTAVTGTALPFAVTAPLYTNVCEMTVWYTVEAANYETATNSATVRITPRDIANATIAPIDDIILTGAAVTPVPTVTDGDPSIITADDYDVSYSGNDAPGTATMLLTGKGNYKGTNLVPFRIAVAELTAEIGWKFLKASGTYFAQLKLTCTNGLASGIGDLRFLFADRVGADGALEAALWNTPARAANPNVEHVDGETFRFVPLDASLITAENAPATFGVADLAAATVPVAERTIEMYVHRRVVPQTGNEGAAKVGDFVGYVSWKSGGASFAVPVVAGQSCAAAAFHAMRPLAAPLPAGRLNESLAVGVPVDAASSPYCKVAAFAVAGGVMRGVVEVGAGARAGALGANATVTLLGAAAPGGPFAEIAKVEVAADGAFALAKPAGCAFFKLRIDVAEVVR